MRNVPRVSNVATIASIRLSAACLIMAGLWVQAWADLTYGTFTWAQLPGFFTPVAALAGILALVCAAVAGAREPHWVSLLRVNAATYAVITGVVYWTLLAQHVHPKVPWANVILHGGAGILLAADWLVVGPRRRLPWHTIWTVLAIPAMWLGYLGLRAAHDGWVPYPFLDPALGAVKIAGTIAVMMAAGLAVAAALRSCTALRFVGIADATTEVRVPA